MRWNASGAAPNGSKSSTTRPPGRSGIRVAASWGAALGRAIAQHAQHPGPWGSASLKAASRTATAATDALLSILLAPVCAVCQQLLAHPTRDCVCDACWASVKRLAPPVCDRCGEALPTAIALCRRCRRMPRAIDRGRAAGLYEGSLRAIIHAFKYEGRRSLAAPLGALMRRQADASGLLNDVAWIVPVPLHWRRARRRGFNQAADLARTLGPPVLHALRRTRATTPQADLPAARRHKNVRGAFALARAPQMLAGRCVLLVDDVTTTGATLDACARVLKEAGAGEVRALTAARVATPRSR